MDYEYILISVGVPAQDVEHCMEWAFGDGYGSMSIVGSHNVWNKRHGDLLVLHGHDILYESIKKIGRLYSDNAYVEV